MKLKLICEDQPIRLFVGDIKFLHHGEGEEEKEASAVHNLTSKQNYFGAIDGETDFSFLYRPEVCRCLRFLDCLLLYIFVCHSAQSLVNYLEVPTPLF